MINSPGVFGDGLTVSVMEGYSITLNSGLSEMRDDDLILWVCLNKFTLLAEINKRGDSMTVYDDVFDGSFRDRLKLDKQTGSLTITNTTTDHSGFYELQINRMKKFFVLTVYGELNIRFKCFIV